MDDILLDRIKAHRSAPDVYDPPTFDEMADRIIKLEKAYDAWAEVAASYKKRCEDAEAALRRSAMRPLRRTEGTDE
jgi:hypothetical protein